jgi:6-pyruvoyltetrahydropterin/6-carboxytetrahydropterin synthase
MPALETARRHRMIAHLTRRYHFSASHRLHAESLTDQQNRDTFGKCNNPYGHGHNYVVAVTYAGPVSPVTGMVCNLADLDAFAQEYLLKHFDHMNLNSLDLFQNLVPSTENLSVELYRIFDAFPHARLETIHVEETGNNSFDYAEPAPLAAQ